MIDPYLDSATGVLRNLPGISDPVELGRKEAQVVAVRDVEIARHPIPGAYDLAHLRAFHAALFRDMYAWAGEIRTVDIAKPGTTFCRAEFIKASAGMAFSPIPRHDYLRGCDHATTAAVLAEALGEINALHPFREGNGRAQRALMRQLSAAGGWALNWDGLDPEQNIEASRAAMRQDYQPLTDIISARLSRIPEPDQPPADGSPENT